ncbi:MAG: DNA polymerase beta domain protein region [Clostridia bacterium 62_21]|nr:MAG: DNA polymerase beta domain protein region [Clostridia bacterium 62_21]
MRRQREILEGLVRHLEQVCPGQVRAVILYGSRARGDARQDSDVDVLVLVRDRRRIDRDRIYEYVLDATLENGLDISLSIYDADDFERLVALRAPFALNVVREGETLWRAS